MSDQAPKKGWLARQIEQGAALEQQRKGAQEQRGKKVASFVGVTLYEDWIDAGGKDGGHSVAGATATVDTAGAIESRVSLTRLVALGGVGGLIFKKKKDRRELYLLVEGPDYSFVREVDPNDGKKAREFAAKITSTAARAKSRAKPSGEATGTAAPRTALGEVSEASASEPPGIDDPLAQIERLARLREQGAISVEEFDAKKQQLLDRL